MTVEELLAARKGSYIRLDLFDNSLVRATLMGGLRAVVGDGTNTVNALRSLTANAEELDSTPTSVWAMTVIGGGGTLPCAIILVSLDGELKTYFSTVYGTPLSEMEPDDLNAALDDVQALLDTGNTLITWDGMRRDFPLLAAHDKVRVSEIAVRHHSLAFDLFCRKGFPIAMDTICRSMNVEFFNDTPDWHTNPDDAIDTARAFLRSLLNLWDAVEVNGNVVQWLAKSGKAMTLNLGYWRSVAEAVELPQPDVTWMDKPMPRSDFLKWVRVQ